MTNDTPELDHDEERASEFRSYVGLALAAVLVIGAVWLVKSFREHNRFESYRDCRRLQTVRGWSHGKIDTVLAGGA